jgi:hypothetical protein
VGFDAGVAVGVGLGLMVGPGVAAGFEAAGVDPPSDGGCEGRSATITSPVGTGIELGSTVGVACGEVSGCDGPAPGASLAGGVALPGGMEGAGVSGGDGSAEMAAMA